MDLKVAEDGAVALNGTVYIQKEISGLERKSDPCYWCAAYRNMRLCDVICGHCQIGKVFVRKMKGASP